MLSNDMKKGMKVIMRGGWKGTIMNNRKGNLRMVEVQGFCTDTGDNYVWNIARVEVEPGKWEDVELTDKQKKARSMVKAMGFG